MPGSTRLRLGDGRAPDVVTRPAAERPLLLCPSILPRLAAPFNRSTLLIDASQPDGENPADYRSSAITNHFARIVHATTAGGRGYAFPYDDVVPARSTDQSGAVFVAANFGFQYGFHR